MILFIVVPFCEQGATGQTPFAPCGCYLKVLLTGIGPVFGNRQGIAAVRDVAGIAVAVVIANLQVIPVQLIGEAVGDTLEDLIAGAVGIEGIGFAVRLVDPGADQQLCQLLQRFGGFRLGLGISRCGLGGFDRLRSLCIGPVQQQFLAPRIDHGQHITADGEGVFFHIVGIIGQRQRVAGMA